MQGMQSADDPPSSSQQDVLQPELMSNGFSDSGAQLANWPISTAESLDRMSTSDLLQYAAAARNSAAKRIDASHSNNLNAIPSSSPIPYSPIPGFSTAASPSLSSPENKTDPWLVLSDYQQDTQLASALVQQSSAMRRDPSIAFPTKESLLDELLLTHTQLEVQRFVSLPLEHVAELRQIQLQLKRREDALRYRIAVQQRIRSATSVLRTARASNQSFSEEYAASIEVAQAMQSTDLAMQEYMRIVDQIHALETEILQHHTAVLRDRLSQNDHQVPRVSELLTQSSQHAWNPSSNITDPIQRFEELSEAGQFDTTLDHSIRSSQQRSVAKTADENDVEQRFAHLEQQYSQVREELSKHLQAYQALMSQLENAVLPDGASNDQVPSKLSSADSSHVSFSGYPDTSSPVSPTSTNSGQPKSRQGSDTPIIATHASSSQLSLPREVRKTSSNDSIRSLNESVKSVELKNSSGSLLLSPATDLPLKSEQNNTHQPLETRSVDSDRRLKSSKIKPSADADRIMQDSSDGPMNPANRLVAQLLSHRDKLHSQVLQLESENSQLEDRLRISDENMDTTASEFEKALQHRVEANGSLATELQAAQLSQKELSQALEKEHAEKQAAKDMIQQLQSEMQNKSIADQAAMASQAESQSNDIIVQLRQQLDETLATQQKSTADLRDALQALKTMQDDAEEQRSAKTRAEALAEEHRAAWLLAEDAASDHRMALSRAQEALERYESQQSHTLNASSEADQSPRHTQQEQASPNSLSTQQTRETDTESVSAMERDSGVVQELELALEQERIAKAQLQSMLDTERNAKQQLEVSLQEEQDARQNAENVSEKERNAYLSLQKELDEIRQAHQNMQTSLEREQTVKQQLESELMDLRPELQQLQAKLQQEQSAKRELDEQLENHRTASEQIQSTIQQQADAIETANRALDQHKARVEQLENALQDAQNQAEAKEETNTALDQHKAKVEQLEDALRDAQHQISAVKQPRSASGDASSSVSQHEIDLEPHIPTSPEPETATRSAADSPSVLQSLPGIGMARKLADAAAQAASLTTLDQEQAETAASLARSDTEQMSAEEANPESIATSSNETNPKDSSETERMFAEELNTENTATSSNETNSKESSETERDSHQVPRSETNAWDLAEISPKTSAPVLEVSDVDLVQRLQQQLQAERHENEDLRRRLLELEHTDNEGEGDTTIDRMQSKSEANTTRSILGRLASPWRESLHKDSRTLDSDDGLGHLTLDTAIESPAGSQDNSLDAEEGSFPTPNSSVLSFQTPETHPRSDSFSEIQPEIPELPTSIQRPPALDTSLLPAFDTPSANESTTTPLVPPAAQSFDTPVQGDQRKEVSPHSAPTGTPHASIATTGPLSAPPTGSPHLSETSSHPHVPNIRRTLRDSWHAESTRSSPVFATSSSSMVSPRSSDGPIRGREARIRFLEVQVDKHRRAAEQSRSAYEELKNKMDAEISTSKQQQIVAQRWAEEWKTFSERLEQQDRFCKRVLGKDDGREEMDELLNQIKAPAFAAAPPKTALVERSQAAVDDFHRFISNLEEHISDMAEGLARAGASGLGSNVIAQLEDQIEDLQAQLSARDAELVAMTENPEANASSSLLLRARNAEELVTTCLYSLVLFSALLPDKDVLALSMSLPLIALHKLFAAAASDGSDSITLDDIRRAHGTPFEQAMHMLFASGEVRRADNAVYAQRVQQVLDRLPNELRTALPTLLEDVFNRLLATLNTSEMITERAMVLEESVQRYADSAPATPMPEFGQFDESVESQPE
ncbi:hypothetical protein MPSI1_003975 [Malassezia psittaci]|uniref:Up-regulated during septation protein 1 domain-containing protein n=1 Tax=Malassezia psittaci TaxID=1821823 RepID=A0AAF0FIY1_9BASI|nr:hypothetical protein MPSI1_003975 [Malassezia psittaci]